MLLKVKQLRKVSRKFVDNIVPAFICQEIMKAVLEKENGIMDEYGVSKEVYYKIHNNIDAIKEKLDKYGYNVHDLSCYTRDSYGTSYDYFVCINIDWIESSDNEYESD